MSGSRRIEHRPRGCRHFASASSVQLLRRAGTILIATMWIIFVLAGMVPVLGQTMRVEAISSANELSALQVQAVEQAAVQYVLYNLSGLSGQMPDPTDMICEAVPVGSGGFRIIRNNDTTNDHVYCFGMVDECSKLDINHASLNMLESLNDMTTELAPCIIDWCLPGETPSSRGRQERLLFHPFRPLHLQGRPVRHARRNLPGQALR